MHTIVNKLSVQTITEVVSRISAGEYALGVVQEGRFCALYVRRSDDNLAKRLRSWLKRSSRYKSFTFTYASSPKAAFGKECEEFHDFGGVERLDNVGHPQRPLKSDWLCPQCDFYN
jgi:hypothetical protein